MRKRKSTLEQILNKSGKKEYVKHFDPLHTIENHVVVLLFLCLMFLTMAFVFINAPTSMETEVTGLVVDDEIQYEEDYIELTEDVNILEWFTDEFSSVGEGVKYLFNSDRNYFTILTYMFCLAMLGIMISQKPHEERK